MVPDTDASPPKDDAGYLGRLSQAIFMAGLNWKMIEDKWPNFGKAFSEFSPEKVSKMTEKEIGSLMKNRGIVRNERKIRSTIENAKTVVQLQKEFGSVEKYVKSFGRDEGRLQRDIQKRFRHVGPSTARTFLWMAGYKLTPTEEERAWLKAHKES